MPITLKILYIFAMSNKNLHNMEKSDLINLRKFRNSSCGILIKKDDDSYQLVRTTSKNVFKKIDYYENNNIKYEVLSSFLTSVLTDLFGG